MSGLDVTLSVMAIADLGTDAIDVQDDLDTTIETLEQLMNGDARFVRGDWTIGYDAGIDCFVAQCQTTASREDF